MPSEFVTNIGDSSQTRVNILFTRASLLTSAVCIIISVIVMKLFITDRSIIAMPVSVLVGIIVGTTLSSRAAGLSVLDRILLRIHRRTNHVMRTDVVIPHSSSFYDQTSERTPVIEFTGDTGSGIEFS